MGHLSGSCAICRGNLMLRVELTGASSTSTARLRTSLGPMQTAQMTVKRNRIRRKTDGVSHAPGCGGEGFSIKACLFAKRKALPLAAVLAAGYRHEAVVFTNLGDEVSVLRSRGGSSRASEGRHGRLGLLPTGSGRLPTCDSRRYGGRSTVERCAGRLKEHRQLGVCASI